MEKKLRYIERIAGCFAFILCMLLVNEGIRFLVIDDIDSYTRIAMYEMYEQENIDVLFLGSSHAYRSIDTAVMDEKWGVNTFNAGTSSQQPILSYYLLKEAGRKNKLSKVYMEVYYDLMWDNPDYQSPTAAYIVSDYMAPSLNRFQLLWDTGGKDYLVHGLVLGRRSWEKLFEPAYLKENLLKKCGEEYRSYAYVKADNEEYAGKGFVYSRESVEPSTFSATEAFTPIREEALSEKNRKHLDKIIAYCNQEGIELIFYSAPVPDFRLAGCGNYDDYVGQIKHFLEGKNVPYYDFNLCRSGFLKLDDSCFKDNNHLNGEGAEKFSAFFADFFAENADREDIFWKSYAEKMEYEDQTVFGVICEQSKNEDGTIHAHITPVKNLETPVYFAVYKRREQENEYEEYREYSQETDFTLPAGENGYFHIYVSTDPEGINVLNDATFYYG